jgi:hypothetical protein
MFDVAIATLLAAAPGGAQELVAEFLADPRDQRHALESLDRIAGDSARRIAELSGRDPEAIRAFVRSEALKNLRDKVSMGSNGERFPMTLSEMEQTVFGFEAFKAETFVRTGIFPKRYFGFLDEKWDSAQYEVLLRETVQRAVRVVNDYLAESGRNVGLSHQEVAMTFISDGAALKMREFQANIEDFQCVLQLGMKEPTQYIYAFPGLVERLDRELRTDLQAAVFLKDGAMVDARAMYFPEAVVATMFRYLFKKTRAQIALRDEGIDLQSLSADEQFIVASGYDLEKEAALSWRTVQDIRDSRVGVHLRSSAMPDDPSASRIPWMGPGDSADFLLQESIYPWQPNSSWNVVYNTAQKHGTWVGLSRFGTTFNDRGEYREGTPHLAARATP